MEMIWSYQANIFNKMVIRNREKADVFSKTSILQRNGKLRASQPVSSSSDDRSCLNKATLFRI